MSVRFGIALPSQVSPDPSPESMLRVAEAADRLGFDSVWAGDRLFGPNFPILDPLVLLSHLASRTTRVKLGTAVLILPLRNPVVLAKTLSTLHYLSGGRLVLGLSLGGRKEDYEAVGVSFERKAGLFVSSVKLMKKLWTEANVTESYGDWRLQNASMSPRPPSGGLPRMLFGGYAEGVLKRTGRYADGYMAGTAMPPEKFAENWRKILDYAKESGRDASLLEPAKLWYTYVSEDRQSAKRLLSSRLEAYCGKYDVEENCIFGSPEDCVARLNKYYEAGVRTFILEPIVAEVEQVERIRKEIIPRVG